MLTYPPDWGPTEWGPIPFLPEADVLVSSMERQWGDLAAYRGIATSAAGKLLLTTQNLSLLLITYYYEHYEHYCYYMLYIVVVIYYCYCSCYH